jgi:hypothetical protein
MKFLTAVQGTMTGLVNMQLETWPLTRFAPYARNPRKNDHVVDRMIDGQLRLKAARKSGIVEVPVILCDEWTPAQVKAFRLMVNRSMAWGTWDDELLSLELQELNVADLDLSLTRSTRRN